MTKLIELSTIVPGSCLIERVTDNPKILMRVGPFAVSEADTKNKNNRVYPDGVWESIVQSEDIKAKVGKRGMLGELDHPETDRGTRLSNVSHVITDMKKNAKTILQTFEVLDTPMGRIAAALLDAKIPVGVSTRGYGDTVVNEEGVEVVQEGFKFDTTDFVADPSAGLFAKVEEGSRKAIRKAINESISMDPNGDLRPIQNQFLESLDASAKGDEETPNGGDEEMTVEELRKQMETEAKSTNSKLDALLKAVGIDEAGLDNLGDKKSKPFGKKDDEDDKDGDKKTEQDAADDDKEDKEKKSDDEEDDSKDESIGSRRRRRAAEDTDDSLTKLRKERDTAIELIGEMRTLMRRTIARNEELTLENAEKDSLIEQLNTQIKESDENGGMDPGAQPGSSTTASGEAEPPGASDPGEGERTPEPDGRKKTRSAENDPDDAGFDETGAEERIKGESQDKPKDKALSESGGDSESKHQETALPSRDTMRTLISGMNESGDKKTEGKEDGETLTEAEEEMLNRQRRLTKRYGS